MEECLLTVYFFSLHIFISFAHFSVALVMFLIVSM